MEARDDPEGGGGIGGWDGIRQVRARAVVMDAAAVPFDQEAVEYRVRATVQLGLVPVEQRVRIVFGHAHLLGREAPKQRYVGVRVPLDAQAHGYGVPGLGLRRLPEQRRAVAEYGCN